MKIFFLILNLSILFAERPVKKDIAFQMVMQHLKKSDVPESFIVDSFKSDKVKIHSEIPDKFARPYEKKTWEQYRKIFVKESRIVAGTKFFTENYGLIDSVSRNYKVDPYIIVTIAGIESNYGVHHSQFSVFNSLYTQIREMPKRAKWASRELAEFLTYCYNDKLDAQLIGGSYAGAFGFGQFIPSSFNNYAVDFNKDGIRQPYEWPDVLASIANYLRRNGYKENSNNYDRNGDIWKSIYAYNHADNYVMAVLELAEEIRKRKKSDSFQ
ncbi:MAG: hypothetical protein CMG74_00255 [Candidatus Marinimicrobia bacterium]|nr:hypothetical protein [Candidatus Neomarinimicrobiota bacterium]|tara:strand:- start:64472 stop:65278 length:807 start_codon:yes stop_codon:yes gene_type:complete